MTYGEDDHADGKGLYDLGVPELYKTRPHHDATPQDLREVYFDDEFPIHDNAHNASAPKAACYRFGYPSHNLSSEDERERILDTLAHERKRIQHILALIKATRNSLKVNSLPFCHSPVNVTSLFRLFVSSESYDAIVGDLDECYAKAVTRQGHSRALLWFWRQVITSLAPFAWAALKRISGLEAVFRRIGR